MDNDSDSKFKDEYKEQLWQEFLEIKEDDFITKLARELFFIKVLNAIKELRFLEFKKFVSKLEIDDSKALFENLIEDLASQNNPNSKYIDLVKSRIQEVENENQPQYKFDALKLTADAILSKIDEICFYTLNECIDEDLCEQFTDFLKTKNLTDDEDVDKISSMATTALFDEEEKFKTQEYIEDFKTSINDYNQVYKSMFLNSFRIKENDITSTDFEFFFLLNCALETIRDEQYKITDKEPDRTRVSELIGFYMLFAIQKRNKNFFRIYNKVINNYLDEDKNEKTWLYSESIFDPQSQQSQFYGRVFNKFLEFYYMSDYIKKVSDYKKGPSLANIDSDVLREIIKKLNIPRDTSAGRPRKS